MRVPGFDYYVPEEIADIAEKRANWILQKASEANETVLYYHNLVSWIIKELRRVPLTKDEKDETMNRIKED